MAVAPEASQRLASPGTPSSRIRQFRRPSEQAPETHPTAIEPATAQWVRLLEASQGCAVPRIAYAYVWKRWIDAAGAAFALLLLSPLLIVVAAIIRLDSRGPAIFRQERVGRGGQVFTVYKFRTMAHDPDKPIHLFRDEDGQYRHKIKNDPRVTRVGRYIRRSSIDELPQLFNVLRGEMSLSGPRPELPQIVQQYAPWQHQRHLVRPGLTGWWQVQGRSDKPMHEHTELDLYYVENLSFRLDAAIVAQTIRIVVKGLGAF
jgi:exopolysaccharide biosynthesis polyprenyl glycosylphosphotransferase